MKKELVALDSHAVILQNVIYTACHVPTLTSLCLRVYDRISRVLAEFV